MSHLPRISGREAIATFEKIGFVVTRQKGSHIILKRPEPLARLVIPDHKELDTGTLRSIIRQADISVDEFLSLLKS